MMSQQAVMEGKAVDLHDLATILLHERLLTEPRFKTCRLREVNNGTKPLDCLPPHIHLPEMEGIPIPRAAYFLIDDSGETGDIDLVEPSTFKHPKFTSTSPLSDIELETLFWQCKDHDSGYVLAHSIQIVLESLPKSTKLRVRTSRGHSLICGSEEFSIAEIPIKVHQPAYICKLTPQPNLGPSKIGMEQYVVGCDGELPLVYLVFGGADVAKLDMDVDGRVMLDLAAPMLGMRGQGGEVFAMERLEVYHHKILSRVASEYEDLKHSGRIRSPQNSQKFQEANQLANRVLARLEKIRDGKETFCGYCGKVDPSTRCSRCAQTRYCNVACQTSGWKYHKSWCKIDATTK